MSLIVSVESFRLWLKFLHQKSVFKFISLVFFQSRVRKVIEKLFVEFENVIL